jgi:hypothetical protein
LHLDSLILSAEKKKKETAKLKRKAAIDDSKKRFGL